MLSKNDPTGKMIMMATASVNRIPRMVLAVEGRKTATTPSTMININAYMRPITADIEEDIRVKGTIETDFISFISFMFLSLPM